MTTTMMTLKTTTMSRSELLQLFTENIGLVYSASKKFIPAGVDKDDWEQECMLYVLEHLDYFDPDRSCWTTYVYLLVWSAWTRSIRNTETKKSLWGRSIHAGKRDDGSEIIQISSRECPEDMDDRIDAKYMVGKMRSATPHDDRLVIDQLLDGGTLTDLANSLGLTRAAISRRWRRVSIACREKFSQWAIQD